MTKRKLADHSAADLAWQPLAGTSSASMERIAVEACLEGPPLADSEWNLLETQGLVEDIKRGRRTPMQAAVLVGQWRDAVRGSAPRIRSSNTSSSLRAEAISQLVAVEANKHPQVVQFRDRILRGRLLEADQLDRWFSVVARKQQFKQWIKVYASPEEIAAGAVFIDSSNTVNSGFDILSYTIPGTDEVRRILVSSKGILGWLRWLSETLSVEFCWTKAATTTFVLTGATPPIPESTHHIRRGNISALTRVQMVIDPAMSPREVSALYREIRLRHFGRRHRSMSEKHIELAKFWSTANQDLTWKALRDQWNALHHKWAYKRDQNFARDCEQARNRLLGQSEAKMFDASARDFANPEVFP